MYNNGDHISIGQSPFFFATYRYHSQFQPKLPMTPSNATASNWVQWSHQIQKKVRGYLEKATAYYKQYADQCHEKGPICSVGQKVWLSMEHLCMDRPSRKLDYHFLCPYQI